MLACIKIFVRHICMLPILNAVSIKVNNYNDQINSIIICSVNKIQVKCLLCNAQKKTYPIWGK